MPLLALMPLLFVAAGALPDPPAGYSVQKGDCGYPVCGTITPGPVRDANASALAHVCNATDGCEGFNSNGWLKRCLPPRCAMAESGMEPEVGALLYTKLGPPKPMPPPPPVAPRPDLHYPEEEREALSHVLTPTVHKISGAQATISGGGGGSAPSTVEEGAVFGAWRVLAVHQLAEKMPPCVVLESLFTNFGVLRFVGLSGLLLQLRVSVGLASTPQPRFNFTSTRPDYFERATEPDDWLAQRAMADSPDGESWYLESWKYLAPSRDYGLLGAPEAGMKWIMNHDGRIKRATQYSTYEPDNASVPLTPPMGVLLFDPSQHIAHWPTAGGDFTDRKSGYVGGYLRAIAHTSFDNSTATGFAMMALSPAGSTPESSPSVLVRIADVTNSSGVPGAYRYFAVSDVNRSRAPAGPLCTLPDDPVASTASAFYRGLYGQFARWNATLAPAMTLYVPYTDRRVADMALAVIVSGLSVFLRSTEPNYGTGGYWCVDCLYSERQPYRPGYAKGDGQGCYCHAVPERGATLPLTSLALDNALLEFGLVEEAQRQVGFYFQTYIYETLQVPGHLKPPPTSLAPPPSTVKGCVFGPRIPQTAVLGCAADKCKLHDTLANAQQACIVDTTCTGIDQGGPPAGPASFFLRDVMHHEPSFLMVAAVPLPNFSYAYSLPSNHPV